MHHLLLHSSQPLLLIFFCPEQGKRNDLLLLSKYDGSIPQDDRSLLSQDDRSLLSTPACSTNIKSDSVHCGPLSCVASGSRCHTADYLKDLKDVESSRGPGVLPSLLKSPSVSTSIKSDSVHCGPLSCVASGSRCHTADYLKEMKDVDASKPCLMYSFSNPPPPVVHVFSKSCANSSLRTQCAAAASANAHCPTVFHCRNCRARKKRRNQDLSLREMVVPPNQVKISIAQWCPIPVRDLHIEDAFISKIDGTSPFIRLPCQVSLKSYLVLDYQQYMMH